MNSFRKHGSSASIIKNGVLVSACEQERFNKKKHTKPLGFTNNPKYFGKKPLESSSYSEERESYSFKGKRKFKNRSNRPKQFTFKKYNKKRKKF